MKQRQLYLLTTTAGLLFSLLLSSCSMPKENGVLADKQTYIDANLKFSISYPESWAPFLAQAAHEPFRHNSVIWAVKKEGVNNDLSLQIISITSTQFIPEAQPADILFDIYPNLTLVSKKMSSLGSEKVEKLDGYTPNKTIRAWILRSSIRDYLLIFTAPPDHFAEQSRLFDDIANSFEVLP